MIEKIIAIRNVGRLRNCPAVELRRFVLLYGENARGKTTLSAVLRSLAAGDPSGVLERQTLGQSDACAVDFLVDGHKLSFQNGVWQGTCPPLLVFDPTFIRRNVHAGYEVTPEHRQNLAYVALGQRAVQLIDKVRDLTKARGTAADAVQQLEQQITDCMVSRMSVGKFVGLAPDVNVDEKIAAAKRDLESVQRLDAVRRQKVLSPLPVPPPPFETVREALQAALPDVALDAERQVKEHISAHLKTDADGEAWLGQGTKYAQDSEVCPFCAQSTSGLGLIRAYRSYFSEAYRAHRERILAVRTDVGNALSESAANQCRAVLQANDVLLEFWAQHVDVAAPSEDEAETEVATGRSTGLPAVDETATTDAINSVRGLLAGLLDRKLASPLDPIEPGPEFETSVRAWKQVEATARTYNEAVSVLNERIEGRRREIGEVDPASAQARLNLLLNVKRRHEPDVVALCSRHSVACAQWSDLDRTTKSHQAQVRKAGDASAKQYAGAVREYLKRFNCSFDLVIEKPDLKASGKPRMTYLIRINDEDVDPVAPGPSSAVPCFRNTLSDGDITTLAFALFLAQLDEVPNLQDRTIVFDDPLPSQDGHRRQQTVQELVRLGSKAGQLIVMSHDRMFLRQVWDALADRRQQQEVSALHFARSGVDSDVQPWDIPSQTDMAWFGDYDVVDRYAARDQAGTNLRNIAGTIRRVLEYYLRIMAPNELPPDTTLGQIISLIRGAAAGSRLADFGPVLTELEDINAALVDSAHAEGYEPKASIDDTQLSGIARRAVALMRGWAPRAA